MKFKIKDYSYLDIYKDKYRREKIKNPKGVDDKRFKAPLYSYENTLIAREIKSKAYVKYGFNTSLTRLTREEEKSAFAWFWVAMEISLSKKENKTIKLNYDEAEAWWWNATNDYQEARDIRNSKDISKLKLASKAFEQIDETYKPLKLINWTNLEGNYAYFEEGAWRK